MLMLHGFKTELNSHPFTREKVHEPGFSSEAGDRTFDPVVFHSMSGALISIFEGFFIILLLQFVFT